MERLKREEVEKGGCLGADALLKALIQRHGHGTFELRSSASAADAIVTGCLDAEGMIRDVRGGVFHSLNQWAKVIQGRPVSVKPVIFYLNKSLRQHESDAQCMAPSGVGPGAARTSVGSPGACGEQAESARLTSAPARSAAPTPHMLVARQAKRERHTTEGSTVGGAGEVGKARGTAAGGRAVRQSKASETCDSGEKVHMCTHTHTHTHTHTLYIFCINVCVCTKQCESACW